MVRPCLSYGSGKASESFAGMEIGECKATVCDAKLAGSDKILSPWQQRGNNGGTRARAIGDDDDDDDPGST